MARQTVLYFEDENGYGRVARDKKTTGSWSDGDYQVETKHDYLVVERYEDGTWVETEHLGEYTDPNDLEVPKP